MATDPRFPHWEERRHGWEPVNKMPKIKTKKPLRFEYWQTAKKEWYWHLVAKNGKIVAVGGEGYKRRSGVLNAFHAIFDFEVSPIITQIFPDKPKVRPYEGKIVRNWP